MALDVTLAVCLVSLVHHYFDQLLSQRERISFHVEYRIIYTLVAQIVCVCVKFFMLFFSLSL